MTPEERKEVDDIARRLAALETIVAERLEPDTTQGPEEDHQSFVARVRARRKQ